MPSNSPLGSSKNVVDSVLAIAFASPAVAVAVETVVVRSSYTDLATNVRAVKIWARQVPKLNC